MSSLGCEDGMRWWGLARSVILFFLDNVILVAVQTNHVVDLHPLCAHAEVGRRKEGGAEPGGMISATDAARFWVITIFSARRLGMRCRRSAHEELMKLLVGPTMSKPIRSG